jgi:hypothetical protein
LVVADPTAANGLAIAQASKDRIDYRFPLAIYKPYTGKDLELSVRFKAVDGTVDEAGGIAVRLLARDDYYIARANALEDNVRFYRVIKGKREQVAGANVKVAANQWHTLALKAEGDRFIVSFDGKALISAKDGTFPDAGKVALWTKADSVTTSTRSRSGLSSKLWTVTEEYPMRYAALRITLVLALIGVCNAVPNLARAEGDDPAALAAAMKDATATLQGGLNASEREGTPISAKFEIEDGELQLSMKDDGFAELVADPKTGAVKEAEKIKDADDLKAATSQKAAMAKAKVPLAAATENAVKANTGSRAVSVYPLLQDGRPVAEVTLLQGTTTKKVTEKLD